MFCENCGTKNANGAKFCEKCGAPMAVVEKVNDSPVAAPKVDVMSSIKNAWGKVTRKQKMIALIVIIVAVIIGGGYYVGNSLTNPEKVVESYLKALKKHDFEKMYDYLEVKESTFATKEMFKKITEVEDEDDLPDFKYTIRSSEVDGDRAEVKVKLTDRDEDEDYKFEIKLVESGKKFLFFTDWKIASDKIADDAYGLYEYLGYTVEDYEIEVIKGAKVIIEDVELTDDYLKDDDSSYDVYEIPAMFIGTYDVKIELPLGITVEDEIKVSDWDNNYSYTYFDVDDLNKEQKEALANRTMALMQDLYNNAIAKKAFADIESSYKFDGIDMDDLKYDYDDFVSDLHDNYYVLTEITLSNPELDSIDFNDDGTITVDIDVKYTGKTKYTYYDGTFKTYDESGTNYYQSLDLMYIDGQYQLVGIDSLDTYF